MSDLQPIRSRVMAASMILTAADAGDLPEPIMMTVSSVHPLTFYFDSLDDLLAWAMWTDSDVEGRRGPNSTQHTAKGEKFDEPVDLVFVELDATQPALGATA